MFSWNIGKSAEAMFSRWALKYVFKFLLKRKLGKFLLGDLDIEQLDVQLREGTIKLTDLALDVDCINQKLSASLFALKEGSIGSLLVRLPWKAKTFQLEVDELELVFSPSMQRNSTVSTKTCMTDENDKSYSPNGSSCETTSGNIGSISIDVHEGVKTIANVVKWLLTSFHVKVKNLIIVIDPSSEKNAAVCELALILRISNIEYGTHVSDDDITNNSYCNSFLGMTKLTNFFRFQGAAIEFVQMNDIRDQLQQLSTSEPMNLGLSSSRYPLGIRNIVLTGESGGVSGTLGLKIPLENGSLDTGKVDADIVIDPLQLHIHPVTVRWVINLWESLKDAYLDIGTNEQQSGKINFLNKPAFHRAGNCAAAPYQDMTLDDMLPLTRVITDWVPSSCKSENISVEAEMDYGASVDQFFECFDGLRSSQTLSANGNLLNWTCSVFSAISAASTLASGSMYMPSEKQHIETNLRASILGISIILFPHDEDQSPLSGGSGTEKVKSLFQNNISCSARDNRNANFTSSSNFMWATSNIINLVDLNVHYLVFSCQDIDLVMQFFSQKMKIEAKIKKLTVNDYHCNNGESCCQSCRSDACNHSSQAQHLQSYIQSVLPSCHYYDQNPKSEKTHAPDAFESTNEESPLKSHSIILKDGLDSFEVMKSLDKSACTISITSEYSESKQGKVTSFSLNFEPFILWVDLNLLNTLLNFLKNVHISPWDTEKSKFRSSTSEKNDDPNHGSAKIGDCENVGTSHLRVSWQGNILLHYARIILCLPGQSTTRCDSHLSSWKKFICFDFSPYLDLHEFVDTCSKSDRDSHKKCSYELSSFINFKFSTFNAYLITSASNENFCAVDTNTYCSQKIFSFSDGIQNCHCVMTLFWQEGTVTGPWVVKRAWDLGSSHDPRRVGSDSPAGDCEFASVKTMKNTEELSSHIQEEMILSSGFFLWIYLPLVHINLKRSEYLLLNSLIDHILNEFSTTSHDLKDTSINTHSKEENNASQISIFLECDTVDLCIYLDKMENQVCSIQTELPGRWDCLKLTVNKFELFSVSNIGGIKSAKFVKIGHSEGELRGYITESKKESCATAPDFLLISCKNSTMQRGGGEGTNALSSLSAGSEVVYLLDPQNFRTLTSIIVRCGTIVAPGGRLDWINAICSFFSLPSEGSQPVFDENNSTYGGCLFVDLVDIALSYEPYAKNVMIEDVKVGNEFTCSETKESHDQYMACLLAAASLNVCSLTKDDLDTDDYIIKLQDIGFLLCPCFGLKKDKDMYAAKDLKSHGYVKVAGETLVRAILRTNRIHTMLWEIEFSDSQVNLNTCHDTTTGLIRLIAQLQQLFAPDMEESMVHLQSRWDAFQKMNDTDGTFNMWRAEENNFFCKDMDKKEGTFGITDEMDSDTVYLDENQIKLHVSPSEEECEGVPTTSHKACFSEIIESYVRPSILSPRQSSPTWYSSSENDFLCRSVDEVCEDSDIGMNGWYDHTQLNIVEDHIAKPCKKLVEKKYENTDPGKYEIQDNLSKSKGRIIIKDVDVRWRMYAGTDWCDTRKNSLATSNTHGRDASKCLELLLTGIKMQYDLFPDDDVFSSKLSFSIQDIHLLDCSRDAPWTTVLGYYDTKDHPRESCAKALKLDLEAVKPDPSIPLEEYRLRLAFLPMRLHLDQSHLDFLVVFFSSKSLTAKSTLNDISGSNHVSEGSGFQEENIVEEALLPFFQKCDIWPLVVRIDYNPRHFDLGALRAGNYMELLNVVPWKGIELTLKHVQSASMYGWGSVCEAILGEWLEDISHNQVHKLLKGIAPVRSLFAVGSGVAKLVSLPVKSYRKDKKLLKGIQRGAISFLRSISVEAVGLGVHLAAGAHDILVQTECFLTNIPPTITPPMGGRTKTVVRSNQPQDIQDGLHQAYESLRDGLGKSASSLIGNPLKTYHRGAGAGSAFATAIRSAPAASIAPASAAAHAVHCALLGVRNSLDPDLKKESMEKYSGPSPSWDCRK